MNNTQDTYIGALKAVANALDALGDAKYTECEALSYRDGQPYDAQRHAQTVGEHSGITQAALVVFQMIDEARRAVA